MSDIEYFLIFVKKQAGPLTVLINATLRLQLTL